ncbi:MAG: hypothetical protein ACJ8AG_08480 [Ktedonobacteraceae bacterium]
MNKKSAILGILIVLLGVIGIAALTNGGARAQTSTSQVNSSGSQRPIGIPAITPTLNTAAAGSPHFTVEDVKQYIAKHGFHGGPTTTGGNPQIRAIDFISSQEASARLHGASIGLPDTTMICYVELYGPFHVKASLPAGAAPFPPSNIGVEIFDAQTGNLVMEWTQGYDSK